MHTSKHILPLLLLKTILKAEYHWSDVQLIFPVRKFLVRVNCEAVTGAARWPKP
jgi:hypothetical protein